MYMDDIKVCAKNEKELETLIQTRRIYSQDIGMKFGIEKCAMLIIKSGKIEVVKGIELPNQESIRSEKENYKYLRSGDKGKNKKRVLQKNEKASWNQDM